MKVRIIIFTLLFLAIGVSAFSQSKKKRNKRKKKENTEQSTSLEPYYPQKTYEPRASKKVKGPTYESEEKFYERMEEVDKNRKRAERALSNPQYSDPSYFGHKRPPKKHKPGKIRFCKECGIRH